MVKYLACTRDYVQKIEVNSDVIANKSANEHSLVGWSDTDFAEDVDPGSTSCAVLRLDGAVIHTHSRNQTVDCDKHGRGRNVWNFVGHI